MDSISVVLPLAMVSAPLVATPDTRVQDAIAQLSQAQSAASSSWGDRSQAAARAGCVWVLDQGQVVGSLTERDVVRLCHGAADFQGLRLRQVMTPVTVMLPLAELGAGGVALQLLRQHGLQYLPIVDEQSGLVGMVTLASLCQAMVMPPPEGDSCQPPAGMTAGDREQPSPAKPELQLLETILDSILAGYWDWDIANHREYLSPGFKRMFGYAEDELPNAPDTWQKLIFKEDLPAVLDCFERHAQSGGQVPYYNEVRYHHKNGSTVWVICTGQVVEWDALGHPRRMIGCHVDITERKQAEAALQKKTQELENFFLISLDLLCIADMDGHFRRVNRSWSNVLGYSLAELEGQSFLDLVHPDDRELTLGAIANLQRQETVQAFVNRYRCKDGTYRYIEWYSHPHGELIYAAARDITQKRKLEIQVRKREAHLKTAQRIAQMGSWEFDVNTGVITWSDEVFYLFGLNPEDGPPSYEELLSLYVPEDQLYHDQVVKQSLATCQPYDLECRAYLPDGKMIYIQARGEPVLDDKGQVVQLVGTVLDITERKQAEETLKRLTDRLTLALKAGAIGTWDWDLVHDALWDERMYEIYGLQNLGRPITYQDWCDCVHPDDLPAAETALQAAVQGKADFDVEFRIWRPDGQLRWIRGAAVVQRQAQGLPVRMTGINRDITARKLAEEQLLQTTAQLAASNRELEAFAYSVSHDLRSPLRAIDGFSKALLEDYGDHFDAEGQDYFERIRRNVQRMGLLIDDLLRLSRVSRSDMAYVNVDLSRLVQEHFQELQSTEPERQVTAVIAPDLVVWADETLMRVVVSNLLQNAWKFTGHHPQAQIEFGQMDLDGQPTYFIRDDGAGFDMAYADMLFGVFQRLHDTHEFPGTGIGLATVQRAIHRHGGKVWATGAIEQGATVYFTLPIQPGYQGG